MKIQFKTPQLRSIWLWAIAALVLWFAMTATSPAQAGRQNQTVPPPTPTPTYTPVPSSTPTNVPPPSTDVPVPTSVPSTNTPVPRPTNTLAPGVTPPTNTPTVPVNTPTATLTRLPVNTPTVTPTPAFALLLEMEGPEIALPGQQVEIIFTVSNASALTATNVRVRDLLPPALILITSEIESGEMLLETEENGDTVVIFEWETVAPGESVQAILLAVVDPETTIGTVIDNLAIVFADNASGNTAGISIGLPPSILPLFD